MTPTRPTRIAVQVAGAATVIGGICLVAYGYAAWQDTSAPEGALPPRTAVTTSPAPLANEDYADPTWSIAPADDYTDQSGRSEHAPDHDAAKEPTRENDPPEWKVVLDGFARAFNRTGGTGDKAVRTWRDQMSQWVTPHLAAAYKTVDPRMLPNTTIDDVEVQSDSPQAVSAVIHYHGIQPVWVLLQPTPDGWRVTQAEPAEQN